MTTGQLQRREISSPEAQCQSLKPTPEPQGFSLIEIMVAITVLGALAGIAIPQFAKYRRDAQNAQAIPEIRKVDLEIHVYRPQNNTYPTTLADLDVSIPNDPWNQPYQYLKIEGKPKAKGRKDHFQHPINTDFDLYSVGPDGLSDLPLNGDYGWTTSAVPTTEATSAAPRTTSHSTYGHQAHTISSGVPVGPSWARWKRDLRTLTNVVQPRRSMALLWSRTEVLAFLP